MNDGSNANYYQLPKTAKEMQDLIEHRNLNFAMGNIFKACYRYGLKDGTSQEYDLNKIIWYATRELNRIRPCPPESQAKPTTTNTTEPPRPKSSEQPGIKLVVTPSERAEFLREMEKK